MGKEENNKNIREQNNFISNLVLMIGEFKSEKILVSQDHHSEDHISFFSTHFKENQSNPNVLSFLGSTFNKNDIKQIQVVYDENTLDETLTDDKKYKIIEKNYDNQKEDFEENKIPVDQGLFPDHCVQGSDGEKIPGVIENALKSVKTPSKSSTENTIITYFNLGSHKNMDSLSLIANNAGLPDQLVQDILIHDKITRVFITGVFLDYIVLNTAIDLKLEYPSIEVIVIEDLTICLDDKQKIIEILQKNKIKVKKFAEVKELKKKWEGEIEEEIEWEIEED